MLISLLVGGESYCYWIDEKIANNFQSSVRVKKVEAFDALRISSTIQ